MRLSIEVFPLHLKNPFKLSYGATTVRENVLIHLDDGVYRGVGEAAVVPYYGETAAGVVEQLSDPAVGEALQGDPLLLEDALDRLPPLRSMAARAALDIALHDLWGQRLGQPLYRLWGLNPARCPRSSFTVALPDDERDYRARLEEAAAYGIVKLKLGSGDVMLDLRLATIARETLPGDLCVDANGGWSAQDALAIIPELAALGVLFIEQPVARDDITGWRRLRAGLSPTHPPLIADESVQGLDSVLALAGLADGINVKLAKFGGLRPARQLMALARALGLMVMVGCMVESAVAVTAAAHLAPMADYADLDAPLLITNNPYHGAINAAGYLTLPAAPGLGVRRVAA